MKNRKFFSLKNIKAIITIIFFIAVCMFTQNFYKTTLGFIANNEETPLFLLTMTVAYVIPLMCFLFYFCNYFVKKFHPIVTVIYSVIVRVSSIGVLINIFQNIGIYVSNSSLGVYQTLPSLLFGFPYDMIIVHLLLVVLQVFNLIAVFKPNSKIAQFKNSLIEASGVKVNIFEYLAYALLTILSCLFGGLFFCGLSAIENILYDAKFIFLLLWYLVPTLNLVCLVFKFEDKIKGKIWKSIYMISIVLVNILFVYLYNVFEAIDPNFVVHIGKPLLPITFSISQRIEFLILEITQIIGVIITLIKYPFVMLKAKKEVK